MGKKARVCNNPPINYTISIMINKITELAKKNLKISDFHLRGGSDIACRIMGEIVIEKNSKIESKDIDYLLKNNCTEEEINIFKTKK